MEILHGCVGLGDVRYFTEVEFFELREYVLWVVDAEWVSRVLASALFEDAVASRVAVEGADVVDLAVEDDPGVEVGAVLRHLCGGVGAVGCVLTETAETETFSGGGHCVGRGGG